MPASLKLTESDQALARRAPKLENIGADALDDIARLALLISQVEGCESVLARPVQYHELPERTRANQRATVLRIVQAMVLLGWIEAP
jgi:hypothetical protein